LIGDPNEGAEQPPQEGPKEDREQHDDRRHRQCAAGDARLDIIADYELYEVESDEHAQNRLPAFELRQRQQRWKQRCD
jgi:hypothetical protein